MDELISDHFPVFSTLSFIVLIKKRNLNLTNQCFKWELSRNRFGDLIDLKVRLKKMDFLERQAQMSVKHISFAASEATPASRDIPIQESNYPIKVRYLIMNRRKAGQMWHRTRKSIDKKMYSNNQSCKRNQLMILMIP